MRNNIDELLEEEARIRQQEEDEIKENPLMQYSTSQLKAELRRRKKERLGMAKAVLIMDMPEQVCQKCTLCYETENDDEYLCCATGKLVPDGAKPDWCPLRELPEKIPELKSGYEEISKSIHRDGWNACLDEILGGKDDGTTV